MSPNCFKNGEIQKHCKIVSMGKFLRFSNIFLRTIFVFIYLFFLKGTRQVWCFLTIWLSQMCNNYFIIIYYNHTSLVILMHSSQCNAVMLNI